MTTKPAPSTRRPADVLREARRSASTRKRAAVFRTVDAMRRDGTEITYAAVARAAGVSQWLVYAEGVREYIAEARDTQMTQQSHSARRSDTASQASLRTDLELARQDNKALRAEISRLKTIVHDRLGQRLDAESNESLRRRIDELVDANASLHSENTQLANELTSTRDQLAIADDDLAAARTSLRRMIKNHSADIGSVQTGD
ncbi:DUF6262 family protein [Mycolicibacterium sp. Y3]